MFRVSQRVQGAYKGVLTPSLESLGVWGGADLWGACREKLCKKL